MVHLDTGWQRIFSKLVEALREWTITNPLTNREETNLAGRTDSSE